MDAAKGLSSPTFHLGSGPVRCPWKARVQDMNVDAPSLLHSPTNDMQRHCVFGTRDRMEPSWPAAMDGATFTKQCSILITVDKSIQWGFS